jgi:hypothetical protein
MKFKKLNKPQFFYLNKKVNFTLFVPCIVDNQFTTLSQQNAQCFSLDIYVILQHWVSLYVSIHMWSSSGNSIK